MTIKKCAESHKVGGNTKTPTIVNPSKNWVFTYNNYKDIVGFNDFCASCADIECFVFQEEKGKLGTPHLQGYVKFNSRKRPMSVFKKYKEIHWEKCRSPKDAIKYCTKEETRNGSICSKNIIIPKKIKIINKLRPWQEDLENIIKEEPCDRSIYWIFEETGGVGKSSFAKYLIVNYNTLCLSGKGTDMKYGVASYINKKGGPPDIIILDVPRSNMKYISYTGIEEIKNGFFFSPKYESEMVVFNTPHVLIFANDLPDYEDMSADRWQVYEIKDQKLCKLKTI